MCLFRMTRACDHQVWLKRDGIPDLAEPSADGRVSVADAPLTIIQRRVDDGGRWNRLGESRMARGVGRPRIPTTMATGGREPVAHATNQVSTTSGGSTGYRSDRTKPGSSR